MRIITLDDTHSLAIPSELLASLGLRPGSRLSLETDAAGRIVLTPLHEPPVSKGSSPEAPGPELTTSIQFIKGVGPRLSAALAKKGIVTVEDALYLIPNRYEDRRELRPIGKLRPGCTEVFFGQVVSAGPVASRGGRRFFEAVVQDPSGIITLKWFNCNPAFMKKAWQLDRRGIFTGEVSQYGYQREVHHPEVEWLAADEDPAARLAADPVNFGRIVPVYPLTEGIQQRTMRLIVKGVVDGFAAAIPSHLPAATRERHGLIPLPEALRQVHLPAAQEELKLLNDGATAGHRTLVFDEFFYLELGLALKRQGITLEEGIPFKVTHRYTKELIRLLPFQMTAAQRRVLSEIKEDMMAPHPMHRLVQGDVGSGKTLIAL
ncbi:MAG TPA: DNA helicase RecG, partial [Geobacteraceae bacterium]